MDITPSEISVVVSLVALLTARELLSGARNTGLRRVRLVLLVVALPLLCMFGIDVFWRIMLSDS